jgi:hypothetical protein
MTPLASYGVGLAVGLTLKVIDWAVSNPGPSSNDLYFELAKRLKQGA